MRRIGIIVFLLSLVIAFPAHADINDKLVEAIEKSDIATVKKLIKNGAEVNEKDERGATPLMLAVVNNHIEIVKELLKNNADINIKTTRPIKVNDGYYVYAGGGAIAITLAARKGHIDIVKLLLANGADVDSRSANDWTALMWAAEKGHIDIVKALLDNGVDVNVKDKYGWTALSWAGKKGHIDIVKLLLAKGGLVNVGNAEESQATSQTVKHPDTQVSTQGLLTFTLCTKLMNILEIYGYFSLVYVCIVIGLVLFICEFRKYNKLLHLLSYFLAVYALYWMLSKDAAMYKVFVSGAAAAFSLPVAAIIDIIFFIFIMCLYVAYFGITIALVLVGLACLGSIFFFGLGIKILGDSIGDLWKTLPEYNNISFLVGWIVKPQTINLKMFIPLAALFVWPAVDYLFCGILVPAGEWLLIGIFCITSKRGWEERKALSAAKKQEKIEAKRIQENLREQAKRQAKAEKEAKRMEKESIPKLPTILDNEQIVKDLGHLLTLPNKEYLLKYIGDFRDRFVMKGQLKTYKEAEKLISARGSVEDALEKLMISQKTRGNRITAAEAESLLNAIRADDAVKQHKELSEIKLSTEKMKLEAEQAKWRAKKKTWEQSEAKTEKAIADLKKPPERAPQPKQPRPKTDAQRLGDSLSSSLKEMETIDDVMKRKLKEFEERADRENLDTNMREEQRDLIIARCQQFAQKKIK